MEKEDIIYFDCFAGISGDMAIGAMLDLGVDFDYLKNELLKLNISGYSLEMNKIIKNGISAVKFSVNIDNLIKEKHHTHNHTHNHDEKREHHHRKFKDIKEIINNSEIMENDKKLALNIFEVIAEAEGKVHGKPVDEVHFHEVGAVDSIIDIVGFAICFNSLNIKKVYCSPINIGNGFVKCEHGYMPVPAPAVSEILKGIPVYSEFVKGESTTPTGAAIIKVVTSEYGVISEFEIEKNGYGAGDREFEIPNVLRIIKGKKKTIKI